MDASWFVTSFSAILMVALKAIGVYLALILFTRFAGLRSFSKMSSFDFAVTVAFGSVLASTVLTPNPPLLQSIVALAMLFLIQYGVSFLRLHSTIVGQAVDNRPLLIMDGPKMLEDNMQKARVTKDDLYAKLREANVTQLDQVRAVVLETTGDVSVLHAGIDEPSLDSDILYGVDYTK